MNEAAGHHNAGTNGNHYTEGAHLLYIDLTPSEDSGLEEGGILSTVGGLIVNENGEVLDVNDTVMPGLYAVGEVSSVVVIDLPYFAGGHHLAWNIFIGRAAGRHAAAAAAEK